MHPPEPQTWKDYLLPVLYIGYYEALEDTEGLVRQSYQAIAKSVGYEEREGNLAYISADLGLSAYGVGRMVLKPDAWRLFRYVNTDYVRGYQQATRGGFIFDRLMDSATTKTMYDACHPSNE